jgi:hypothetical protein
MNNATHFGLPTTGTLLAVVIALAGCSSSSEDVRITFCKNLTNALTNAAEDVEWQEPSVRIKRPEYAAVTVKPDANGDSTSATCYFQYDLVDQTAMDHANPILAYATLPFKMTLNGQELSSTFLTKITSHEQIRQGRVALDKVKRVANDAVDLIKRTSGEAAMFAQKTTSDATTFAQEATEDTMIDVNQAPPKIKP